MNLKKLLSFEQGRIAFFETLTKHPENWQQNPTPLSIVRKMVGKTSLDDKKILVLFNIEFLQILVEERKINPENIYYIADNELEYIGGIKIFKVQSYKLNEFTVPALKKLITGLNMKFDLVFSNPPYNGNVDIKILNEIIDVADEFVVVHPSTWVLDLKNKSKLFTGFKQNVKNKLKSLDFFNGNPIFNIALYVPVVISHFVASSENINIDFFESNYLCDSIDKVSKYNDKFDDVNEFITKIKKNSNFVSEFMIDYSMLESLPKADKFYCQLAQIRGNVNLNSSGKDIVKNDFYTMIMKKPDENIGIRKKTRTPTFEFSNINEVHNFISYLKTDFARFCLSIYKDKATLDCGEMDLIPWLDFSEEWDDEKLFEKFEVSQELQDYIREFLPDYYGIRK